jgi:hypothetical protein
MQEDQQDGLDDDQVASTLTTSSDVVVCLQDKHTRRVPAMFLVVASPVFASIMQQPSWESSNRSMDMGHLSFADWDTFYTFIDCNRANMRRAVINTKNVHMLATIFHLYQMMELFQVSVLPEGSRFMLVLFAAGTALAFGVCSSRSYTYYRHHKSLS